MQTFIQKFRQQIIQGNSFAKFFGTQAASDDLFFYS